MSLLIAPLIFLDEVTDPAILAKIRAKAQCEAAAENCSPFSHLVPEAARCPEDKPDCDPWEKDRIAQNQPSPWGSNPPDYSWLSEDRKETWWIYKSDISRDGKQVTVWLNWHNNEPAFHDPAKTVTRVTFDCDGKFRRSAETAYYKNGSLHHEVDRLEDWAYIRPRSSYAVFASTLCSH